MADKPVKYNVVDPTEMHRLIKARWKSVSAMQEKWQNAAWRQVLDDWGKDDLLDFFLGPDLKKELMSPDSGDGETAVRRLSKPDENFPRSTAWKATLLLSKKMMEQGITFLDLFAPAQEKTKDLGLSEALSQGLANYDGWYLSHRPEHENRKFGLINISRTGDDRKLKIDGYTYDDRLDDQPYPTVSWHSIDFVVNPLSGIGYYDYDGWVEGQKTSGFSRLKFNIGEDGAVHGATGTSLDNHNRHFGIRMERIDLADIELTLGREEGLKLESEGGRLAVIRHFHGLYPVKKPE